MGNNPKNRRQDTVAAIATAPGEGGIGIVRITGANTRRIAQIMLSSVPAARQACYQTFRNGAGEIIDRGIVLYFPGPASYTGEDTLEFQAHGGPLVLRALLEAACAAGAKEAQPGEFTRRAFLNGRLDLAQAEAVADLISARTDQAARAAARTLAGQFSTQVLELDDELSDLRAMVEAAIDFPDEDEDFLSHFGIRERLSALSDRINRLIANANRGRLLTEGAMVVLAGRPNVGKSSLLNALASDDIAIVTDMPGTTRDLIRQSIQLNGFPLYLVDTAGLRESQHPIEREGIERAYGALEQADLILCVLDDTDDDRALPDLPQEGRAPIIMVRNKVDATGRPPGVISESSGDRKIREVAISARTGAGLGDLGNQICCALGIAGGHDGEFAARRRHLAALTDASTCLGSATHAATGSLGTEFIAEDLRHAQHALATVVGEKDNEQLLDRIFARFCIGK